MNTLDVARSHAQRNKAAKRGGVEERQVKKN